MQKSIILAILLCLGLVLPVMASPSVILDGRPLTFTDAEPIIENGRTLVPLRAIFEEMGAIVEWDQNNQTATAVKGSTKVILQIGSLTPTINSQVINLDVPAKILNGRTLAPLRFVGEAFGGTVEWNQAMQLISITSKPISGTPPPDKDIKVHFIDVGQADSIYIELPDDNDILIDGGNVADGYTVINYLKAQGVNDIELLIATHPHEDHIGGLPAVFDAFQVHTIIDSGYLTDSKICEEYQAKVDAEGVDYYEDTHSEFRFGNNITMQILTEKETWTDVNDYSVVCRLDIGNIEFMFMGDAETTVEDILTGTLDAEILKVGHHGSSSSSSLAFLEKVDPKVAIISVGEGNTYGHPHQETLSKLQSLGIDIYRTDLNGTIIVSTDGTSYTVFCDNGSAYIDTTKTITQQGTYVGSINSDKYHLLSCRYAQSIAPEDQIWFKTEEEALATGYTPCKVCKP